MKFIKENWLMIALAGIAGLLLFTSYGKAVVVKVRALIGI